MKNHLKRIAAPRTWLIPRQRGALILKPNPGGHPLQLSLPLGILLRDKLQVAKTAYEAKKVLQSGEVLVDGISRRDIHFPVGLFDVVQVSGNAYRLLLDKKGRMVLCPVAEKERSLKLCSITGKTAAPGGKIQIRCHDGRTFLTKEPLSVGDSVLFSLPAPGIEKHLPRVPGVLTLLIGGKHSGSIGIFRGIQGEEAVCGLGNKTITTKKDYLFVVGSAGEKTSPIQAAPGGAENMN